MESFAVLVGLIAGGAFWYALNKSMKINGAPWWWRHLSAAFWFPLALLGGYMLSGSMIGLTSSEGQSLGAAGFVGSLAVLLPLMLPIIISWRGARHKLASEASLLMTTQPIITPERAAKPPQKLKTTPETPSRPEPIGLRPPLESLYATEQAPAGGWQAVDAALIEFEYHGEEEPIAIYAARVCDTHVAGALEGDSFDSVEREYAFSYFKGLVGLPLENDIELPVDQLRSYLLANYADDSSVDESAWKDELPLEDFGSVPSSNGNLRFVYRDVDGNESTRVLKNFKVTAGKVRGICLDRNAIRTFRLDRIEEILEGEELLYKSKVAPRPRQEMPGSVRSGNPEITFSGFDAKTRSELERTAQAHGFLVRKSVTKNLDYFVAGPRRSAAKVIEAEEKNGCSVIDKEGFLWLVATGEVKF